MSDAEVSRCLGPVSHAGVRELWRAAGTAEFFIDLDYGQWGLRVLAPLGAAARSSVERASRPADFAETDLVFAEFLGDQELVLEDLDGRVLITSPLDPRAEWPIVAGSVAGFFEAYIAGAGAKYWE